MKVIFVSNYLNFHQVGLWDEFVKNDVSFVFLSTSKMPSNRIQMKYKELNRPYLRFSYNMSDDELNKLFSLTDVVILGSVDDKRIFRFCKHVPNIFFNSEHQFKKTRLKNLFSYIKRFALLNFYFKNNKKFALCNSYYAAKEYKMYLIKHNNIFKFGYFPALPCYYRDTINNNFLYCGRVISFKKPISALKAFASCKKADAHLYFVGEGLLLNKAKRYAEKMNINKSITWLPFLEHDKILEIMRKCTYYFFTSNHQEGWGAVLNEAMSQGCISFANTLAGSTNYLIKNKVNGFNYRGNCSSLIKQVKTAINSSDSELIAISNEATKTIDKFYNNEIAANRLYVVLKSILNGDSELTVFDVGPMSVSE